ncbi:hypothetical protein ILP92_11590 [Maribius pontilimi]|uniref:Uncharacterized protein n=1 Tax=Palleronia pontilimi TaxID=1964209 RepID=A0A934IAB9_9RHOB|nr:hypothetical protein [Palleronia pontilimi]MBJ3763388.1 hypothetical protein [Palleronia pontilimi]
MNKAVFASLESNSPSKVQKAVDRVLSFYNRPDGWHYGKGHAATIASVNSALRVVSTMNSMELDTIEVFPRTDGGIVVSGIRGEQVVDFAVSADGIIDVYEERDDEDLLIRENADYAFVRRYLEDLGWKESGLSGYFIQTTSVMRVADLIAQQSPPPAMDYRLSMKPARTAKAVPYASTVESAIPLEYPESQQSSRGLNLPGSTGQRSCVMNRKVTSATI